MATSNSDNSGPVDIERKESFLSLITQHPRGFWFIFWGEFAERCSYYGMRAILTLYMIDRLGLTQADAGSLNYLFIAACYFLPLVGAYLADNFFGKYWIIVGFSVPYIMGHVVLGIESVPFLFIALALLAMGSGVIKPNISTLMGLTYDQQRPGKEQLRSTAFGIFYMAINIGAFLSQFSLPTIRTHYGYQVAFLFPTVLMAVAFVIFAAGKRYYAIEVIKRKRSTPQERGMQWQVLLRIAGLFLLVMFFWAIFDQSSSTWILYANTYMDLTVLGYPIDPDQVQSLNPLLIVLLLPPVTFLWAYLARKGVHVRATDKMIVGFILTALCMAVMAYAGFMTGQAETRPVTKDGQPVLKDGQTQTEQFCPPERKVSVGWKMLAFLIITIAEILISVTGLELAFVAAPQNMKSFVTSLWLLTVGLANLLLNVPLSRLYPVMHPGIYFGMLTAMLAVVTVAFVFVAQRFNRFADAHAKQEAALAAVTDQGEDGIMIASSRTGIVDPATRPAIKPARDQS